jgi:hypothetical protein
MWTLQKLQSYIHDKVEENIHLDYKAADSLAKSDGKKKEISKDVSAFANSDGGTIIYGIKEYQENKKFLPEKISPIKRNEFSKETLEQIIGSNISPKIKNVIITPIIVGDEINDEVVYIVEIPKSDTAHQASDKRYYKRYNFQSEAMDDWELKDIINRKNKSEIIVWFEPQIEKKIFADFCQRENIKLRFDIWLQNVGNKAAEYIDLYLIGKKEDAHLFSDPKPNEFDTTFEIPYTNEIHHKVTIQDDEFVVNIQRIPLLPRISKLFGRITILSDYLAQNKEIEIVISTEDNRTRIKSKITDIVNL